MKKHIANGFTLLNLFFGCVAIYLIAEISISSTDVVKALQMAAFCICLSAIVDFLDGFVARLLGIASDMGKQLDSLADVVSFGVAPSFIILKLLQYHFYLQEQIAAPLWMLLPAFILACAGAYRLARFSISTTTSTNFIGLPIPAAGLLVASYPFIIQHTLVLQYWFLYATIFLLSFLMLSKYQMLSLKIKKFSARTHWPLLILGVLSVLLPLFVGWFTVVIVFICYVSLSLFTLPKE